MIKILQEEMMLAQGCTEPIAGAYAGSYAASVLGSEVKRMKVTASQNIVKNSKGVVIPGTSDLCGIVPSAILGVLCGEYELNLEVLKGLNEAHITKTKELMAAGFCELEVIESPAKLNIKIEVFGDNDAASVFVLHQHTNVVEVTKNGEVVLEKAYKLDDFTQSDRSHLTIKSAYDFANTVNTDELTLVKDQIHYNYEIAKEGSSTKYALQVFQNNNKSTNEMGIGFDIRREACAMAAAGSDARMSGCVKPVMTLSGSGNQGICTGVPIIVYAKYYEKTEEELLRAVCFGDLVTIRIKEGIGRLSPMCGVISAGMGAVAGIMYLEGAKVESIEMMIQNSISNNTGVICDGAKPSCALKIYSAIDSAMLSGQLALNQSQVMAYTGIVNEDVEKSINNLGTIAKAMDRIDNAIIDIMSNEN